MNVFVIHSGSDAGIVSTKLSDLKKEAHSFNSLLLMGKKSCEKNKGAERGTSSENGSENKKKTKFEIPFWKIDAVKKIKNAKLIVFFVGQESHTS